MRRPRRRYWYNVLPTTKTEDVSLSSAGSRDPDPDPDPDADGARTRTGIPRMIGEVARGGVYPLREVEGGD